MKNIALFGGSFDPPHLGHQRLLQLAGKHCHLKKIIIMPSFQPYLKKRHLTPVNHRWKMIELAFSRQPAGVISDWEIKRKRPISTYYTYKVWQKKFPGARLFILLGSDSFRQIRRWKNGHKLLAEASFIVGQRPGYPLRASAHSLLILSGKLPNISSTDIRRFIQRKKFSQAKKYLPVAVYEYIRKYRLYQ